MVKDFLRNKRRQAWKETSREHSILNMPNGRYKPQGLLWRLPNHTNDWPARKKWHSQRYPNKSRFGKGRHTHSTTGYEPCFNDVIQEEGPAHPHPFRNNRLEKRLPHMQSLAHVQNVHYRGAWLTIGQVTAHVHILKVGPGPFPNKKSP